MQRRESKEDTLLEAPLDIHREAHAHTHVHTHMQAHAHIHMHTPYLWVCNP